MTASTSLVVYTARLPQPRNRVAGYFEMDALNVARTTSDIGSTFAPSRPLDNEWQRRKAAAKRSDDVEAALEAAWAWFTPLYVAEMRGSYVTHRSDWTALLSHDVVTLCCYCGTATRCHRLLLAMILTKFGADYRGER